MKICLDSDHITGIMEQLYVFLSRIERQQAFVLDFVLMREESWEEEEEEENLLVEMGCITVTYSQRWIRQNSWRNKNGEIIFAKWTRKSTTTWTKKDHDATPKLSWDQSGENMENWPIFNDAQFGGIPSQNCIQQLINVLAEGLDRLIDRYARPEVHLSEQLFEAVGNPDVSAVLSAW